MPVEPNPFDDERLVRIRADQSDPIIQYYIVRGDVPMTVGKVCAQIGHAAQMFVFGYQKLISTLPVAPRGGKALLRTELVERWMEGSFRKVVLRGDTKDFEKIKEELDVFVVRDAGLTEVDPGTETILATWPMYKSRQPKLLARLRVLNNLSPPEDIDDFIQKALNVYRALGDILSAEGLSGVSESDPIVQALLELRDAAKRYEEKNG